MGVVALLTDFETDNAYVGIAHGVILRINPEAHAFALKHMEKVLCAQIVYADIREDGCLTGESRAGDVPPGVTVGDFPPIQAV